MFDTSTLMWGLIFGSIGYVYFSYGRKQSAFVPLFTGLALMVLPYFVPNIYILIVAGIVLMAVPYFIRQ